MNSNLKAGGLRLSKLNLTKSCRMKGFMVKGEGRNPRCAIQ